MTLLRAAEITRGCPVDHATVWEFHGLGVCEPRSVSCEEPFDGDYLSEHQRVAAEPVPNQHVDTSELELPVRDDALVVLHVDIEARVRIGPFNLGDRAHQRDRFG